MSYFSSDEVKEGNLTVGQVTAYMLYNWQMIWNVFMINNNLQVVAKVQGAFYEIACLVTEEQKQVGYYEKKEVPASFSKIEEGTIDIKNIEFNYPTKPDVKVLNRIDIDV